MRVVGVQGVCRVLALFWELIPTPTSRSLLSLLLKELAHDVAAHHPLELAPPPPPPPELPARLLTPRPDGISSCAPPPPHPHGTLPNLSLFFPSLLPDSSLFRDYCVKH